jgi:hypothetical protein
MVNATINTFQQMANVSEIDQVYTVNGMAFGYKGKDDAGRLRPNFLK